MPAARMGRWHRSPPRVTRCGRARAAAGSALGGVTVRVRGGVYRLEAPLAWEPQDSGTVEAPVVFEAYPGERPVLSGARVIAGLQPRGSTWKPWSRE